MKTAWDLRVPVPHNYNLNGSGVINQLVLDSGLFALSEKPDSAEKMGACWKVISERLARYEPVHPILTDLDAGAWPSQEQQLCGQVCAAHFRLQKMNKVTSQNWVTPLQDLDNCLLVKEPTSKMYQNPKGRIDRLLLPWNYNRDGDWIEPSYGQVCAFNLVAQGYLPEGYIVGDLAPPVWSGDTTATSRMAGDLDGPASDAAKNLSPTRYGRARSRSTCGYVGAQCFASLMTEVMENRGNQPSEWQVQLSEQIRQTAIEDKEILDEKNPWCKLIQPYMGREGVLPEGQLDFPCAKGVSDAQEKAVAAMEKLIADYGAEQ